MTINKSQTQLNPWRAHAAAYVTALSGKTDMAT